MATQTLSGQDSTRNGANTMPQPLTRRSFVQGAAALAVAPIVMRVAPKTKPADRMTEITALLLEIEHDYPEIMPEIEAFTRALAEGRHPDAYRALLQTGAELPKIAAKHA